MISNHVREEGPTQKENRDLAFEFEKQILLRNIEFESNKAAGMGIKVLTGFPDVIETLMTLIYALRGQLRSAESGLSGERITPSEACRFACDILICDHEGIVAQDDRVKMDVLLKHVGSLAKSKSHALAISDFIKDRYAKNLPPFGSRSSAQGASNESGAHPNSAGKATRRATGSA